jgi:hypothetical protein
MREVEHPEALERAVVREPYLAQAAPGLVPLG